MTHATKQTLQTIALFVLFLLILGLAGQWDYEDRKISEQARLIEELDNELRLESLLSELTAKEVVVK